MKINKFLLPLAVTTLSLMACSSSDSSNQPKQREEIKSNAKENAARAAIMEILKQSGADVSWMKSIERGKASPFQPLYTIDLEKLWLIDRPIIFVGTLRDVATDTEADYSLIVSASDVQLPELRLEILCAKPKVAAILTRIKSDKESIQPGGVVIAAKITKVKSATEPEKEGTKTVIYGQGRCVDITYLGDAMNLMFSIDATPEK